MRYLFTIVFILMAIPCFAVLTKTYTVCESGCDYSTLASAESAHQQDLVANDSALTFEIQNTWASPDGVTAVAGSTTDATRFFTITAVGAIKNRSISNIFIGSPVLCACGRLPLLHLLQ